MEGFGHINLRYLSDIHMDMLGRQLYLQNSGSRGKIRLKVTDNFANFTG